MTVIIDGNEYLPLDQAARQLGTTETKVLMLLKQKALQGTLVDGDWLVTTSSLAECDLSKQAPTALPDCHSSCRSSQCGCR